MDCFGDEYSEIYDLIYHDKDYAAECDFIEGIFQRYAPTKPKEILDFGCGTGNHALELASRGYRVTGIDRSMNMLAAAQRKASQRFSDASARPDWRIELPAQGEFDVAISMFAVVNYLDGKDGVVDLMKRFASRLAKGGLVILETWNGVAVPIFSEEKREKKVVARGREIVRRTEAKLDWRNQVLDIQFTCFEGTEPEPRVAELHRMHYYTPVEMVEMAKWAGLHTRDVLPTYEFRKLDIKDFSVVYVLQR